MAKIVPSVLISGVPGSGKSTVSRRWCETNALAAHVEADVFNHLIVSGQVLPDERPRESADDQLELRDKNVASVAVNFLDHGVATALDVVVVTLAGLERLQHLLAPHEPVVVFLAPRAEVVLERDASRHKQVAQRWTELQTTMRTELLGHGHWIDSSDLTVDETVHQILSLMPASRSARD